MPNITVSSAVDSFLQAANAAAMRSTLGLGSLDTATFAGAIIDGNPIDTAAFYPAEAFQTASEVLTTLAAGSAFVQFTGPTTSNKVFTLPNATCTILTTNAAVTVAQGGTGVATLPKLILRDKVSGGSDLFLEFLNTPYLMDGNIFDAENDPNSMWNSNGNITVPLAGTYRVSVTAFNNGGGTKICSYRLYKNGSEFKLMGGTISNVAAASISVKLAANDVLTMYAQSGTDALTIYAGAGDGRLKSLSVEFIP